MDDPKDLYCARVRLSRLGHWTNSVSEEIDFNRFEFSISLGPYDAHVARWRMHTCCVALSEHVRRKLMFYLFDYSFIGAFRHYCYLS